MDFNLIYAKTAAGEDAMRERTRIVQRNMRMLLTLIDGKANVADLCAKAGDSQLAEDALRDLEKGGFIEPLTSQNSLLAQSQELAEEIKTAALEKTSGFSTFGDKHEPLADELVMPARIALPSDNFPWPKAGALLPPPIKAATGTVPGEGGLAGIGAPISAKTPTQKIPVARPGLLDRLKTMLNNYEAQEAKPEVSIKPIRRGSAQASPGWPKVLFFVLLGLVTLLAMTAVLFPYGKYLPEVEAALTQASGQTVRVGEIHLSFYPKPGFVLGDVRLGNEAEGKVLRVAELRLLPEFSTLMDPKKVFRQVELTGVVLPVEAIAGFSGVFDVLRNPSSPFGVQQLILEKTDVGLRGLHFSGMGGEIKLAPDGRFESLSLYLPDRSLHLEATPLAEGLAVALEGFSWRPSPDSPFIFDSLNVKGRLAGSGFAISSMNLHIFDGVVQGTALLTAGPQPALDGEIVFERISAKRFAAAFGIGQQFEGETAGTMKFSATANAWTGLFSSLYSDGEFSMGRGSLGGFDLAEAARRASTSQMRGGATRFEQLHSRFKLTPESLRFSSLVLNSGLMQSTGQITVSKERQLSGGMEVQMRGTAMQLNVPLSISGSLVAPVLQAGRS